MKVREFHALSLNRDDESLTKQGLKNRGLLGYINTTQIPGTRPLIHFFIKFPSGPDYFYTADPSKERLEGREPVDHGTVGYVATKNTTGFIQLYRYFHPKHQAHLYLTTPILKSLQTDGFIDESSSNPIFIQQADSDDAAPLYLYSNADATYFQQLSQGTAQSKFPAELVTELTSILETAERGPAIFNVSYDGITSVTISVDDTLLNFYVNKQLNGVYYTVRRNPEPNNESYLVHDIDTWAGVIDRFHRWLEDVDLFLRTQEPPPSSEDISEIVPDVYTKRIYGRVNISIQEGSEIDPAFGVNELGNQIVTIIKNLKAEPGNMVGIFGPWGRGKTYLMDSIWKKLSSDETTTYIQIKYPAWKYQHTPANWAYLYEQFSDKFLGNARKDVRSFINYHKNLFALSRQRDGTYPLIFGVLLILVVCFNTLFTIDYENLFLKVFTILGIPFAATIGIMLIKHLKLDHFTKAFNLIKKYNLKISFKESLGVQAEIQKELTHLIKVWTKSNGKDKQKKLVLFVDDLDRCNKEKVIEVIDSLRIILDDDELKDKLLILTALDERILNQAVISKYDNSKTINELVREYIDKLFIFSIKLTGLTPQDSKEFFEKFTKQEFVVEPSDKPTEKEKTDKAERETDIHTTNQEKPVSIDQKIKVTFDVVTKLTLEEKEIFKRKLELLDNPTPRKIKIIYYRYLFVRNLLTSAGSRQENNYWLQGKNHDLFIEQLIHFSQKATSKLTDEYNQASKVETSEISLQNLTVDKTEYMNLLKLFELAIAY